MAFPTFGALCAMTPSNTPARTFVEARQAAYHLRDGLRVPIADFASDAMAFAAYVEAVSPLLPVSTPETTAAANALIRVRMIAARSHGGDVRVGGEGMEPADYRSHLLHALRELEVAVAAAILSQP